MTPEEREAAEAQIPEWKRGALVAKKQSSKKRKRVFLADSLMASKIRSAILRLLNNSKRVKNMKNSGK